MTNPFRTPGPFKGTLKVFDVVYMEETINGEKVFRQLRDKYDRYGQNSYILYTVGEEGEEDNHDFEDAFDNILKEKYGVEDGEKVVLLMWW